MVIRGAENHRQTNPSNPNISNIRNLISPHSNRHSAWAHGPPRARELGRGPKITWARLPKHWYVFTCAKYNR
jgi:hypothetical protein